MLDCAQHIDFGGPRYICCSTYRQSFSMLDVPDVVKRRSQGRYRLLERPGYSGEMHAASLDRYRYPDGSGWS